MLSNPTADSCISIEQKTCVSVRGVEWGTEEVTQDVKESKAHHIVHKVSILSLAYRCI